MLHRRVTAHEEKVNPAYAAMSMFMDLPQPVSMPKNYKNFAREGYKANDTLYKCINYIIQNGAAIPPKLYTDSTMQTEIKSHPLLDKLARPNIEQSGVDYREAVLGYLLIAGNSYQYAIREGKSGPPDELWTLQPDMVEILPTAKRGIVGYNYTGFKPEQNPIDASNVCHLKFWNPDDPLYGVSPVEVGAILIDQQTAIRKWNLSLLQNKAVPSGVWTTDVILSPNDRQKVEARLNEKMAGARNAGRQALLDGAIKWQSTSVLPSELDWIASVMYNAGQIANLLNIAPQLTGDTSSTTYENMKEAKAASYTEAIFPLNDRQYARWNVWLVPMYPDLCDNKGNPKAYLYYDKESVEVVQDVIQARLTAASQRANDAWMKGNMTMNEARELQGLPPDPNGNVYRFGAIIVRKEDLDKYAEQSLAEPAAPPMPVPEPLPPPGTLPGQQPPAQEKPDANNSGNDANSKPDKPANKPTGKQPDSNAENEKGGKGRVLRSTKALDLRTTEEKSAYAASIETARRRHEDKYEKQLAAHFETERKAVVAALKSSSASSQHVLASRAEGALNNQQSSLKAVLMGLYKDVSTDIGGAVASQLSGKKSTTSEFIELFGEKQLNYLLKVAGAKITQINATTLEKIRQELADGVEEGESIPQIAARIDALYLEQIVPNRSTVIARTEVVGSSNWAAIQSAKSSGLTLNKVWLATGDDRTRATHLDADGQEVGIDEPFEVGGEELDFPGDPGGSSAETVQCRCTVYFTQTQKDGTEVNLGEDDSLEKRMNREAYRKFMNGVLV